MRALLFGAAAGATRMPDGLIVAVDSLAEPRPTGMLLLRRNGVETVLRRLTDRAAAVPRLPVSLRLPNGAVLSRNVTLPLAAVRDMPTVLIYEMNRLTPLNAEELLWGTSEVTTNRARERITLRLSIVLRSQAEALLAQLARLDLRPGWIEADGARIPLTPAGRGRRVMPRNLWAWCCGTLAAACVVIPFLRQELALRAADRAIAAHETAAHLGEAMRRRIAIANSSIAAIAEARREGDALQVLATVTDALPDGTWLDDLSLAAGGLTIDGQSDHAARLIGLLAAMPGLRGPSFTAPVTRSADGSHDQFSLRAGVGE